MIRIIVVIKYIYTIFVKELECSERYLKEQDIYNGIPLIHDLNDLMKRTNN